MQHVASILNRQLTNSEGLTPYECEHGRRSNGRTAEFGERLMHYVSKKLRTKLNLRWRVGICISTACHNNEAYIGTRSGNVLKSQSLAHVVQKSKWDSDNVLRVSGAPMQLCPSDLSNKDALWI